MASLPTRYPDRHIVVSLEPFSPAAFAPFGTAIVPPISQSQTSIPQSTPEALHAQHQPCPQLANQNTALKTSPISPLINAYPSVDAAQDNRPANGLMSIFSCFPRRNTYIDEHGKLKLRVSILERHPFTTQTFCPFNLSRASLAYGGQTFFLIVVAPSIDDASTNPPNPPDLSRCRAFLAPTIADGGVGVAVTYNQGTWHAPMIVLGDKRIDFLVTQFANGHGPDDCQEVLVGGDGGEKTVEIDLSSMPAHSNDVPGHEKAKL